MSASAPRESHATTWLHRSLFLWSLPFTFLYFGLPVVSKAMGASAVEIGGLFSVFTVTTLVLRPVVGWALDRSGRKPFLVGALLLYAVSMSLFALADSLLGLYAARLVQALGSALLWTAANTIVADLSAPGERGRAMGRLTQTTARGGLVGVFAALVPFAVLRDETGWWVVFTVFAATTLLGAWLAWTRLAETGPAPRVRHKRTVLSAPLARLLLIVFISGVPEAMLSPIYLIYLQDKFTTDIWTLAWAFLPAGLVAAFLSARLGALSDRWGRAPMMAVGVAGAGLVSLCMPALRSLLGLAVLYTLSMTMWSISEPAEAALVADLAGRETRGVGFGLYDAVENLGWTIGPVLGGLLYEVLGRDTPFYLNGVILIACALAVPLFLRRKAQGGGEAAPVRPGA